MLTAATVSSTHVPDKYPIEVSFRPCLINILSISIRSSVLSNSINLFRRVIFAL